LLLSLLSPRLRGKIAAPVVHERYVFAAPRGNTLR
jgi:hypothetical protein